MCTVTYIPLSTGFILTSSRDESVYRPTLPPGIYEHYGQKIAYPKDRKAGGTWIAVNERNQMACLLNGAFENHKKKTNYSKSRGQVLIECFQYKDIFRFCKEMCLSGVGPFTLLYIRDKTFHELRWDGDRKYLKEIERSRPSIWSSATLYDSEARNKRAKWFDRWLKANQHFPDFDILNFHLTSHSDDQENDILMKRFSGPQTLSISQIVNENDKCIFRHIDLLKKEEHSTFLSQPNYQSAGNTYCHNP